MILSTVTIVLVSRRGSVTEAEREYRGQLHAIPTAEFDPVELRRTLLWPKLLIAVGFGVAVIMTVFYAIPYQNAVGADPPSGVSGELLFCFGCGLMLIACGLLARWEIKRSFD